MSEKIAICSACSEEIEAEDARDINGDLSCEDCSTWCDGCQEFLFEAGCHATDFIVTDDGEKMCDGCADDYSKCDECDNYFHMDYLHSGHDVALCENCYCNGSYRYCSSCDELSEDVSFCEECDEYSCEDCECDCDGESGSIIKRYGTSPSCGMRFYTLNKDPSIKKHFNRQEFSDAGTLYFGIEAEVEFLTGSYRDSYLKKLQSYAQSKLGGLHQLCVPQRDSSISSHSGVEIVFQPHTLPALKKRLSLIPMPGRDEITFSRNAGCHVNMSRKLYTDIAWSMFIRFVNINKNAWQGASQRTESHYYAYNQYTEHSRSTSLNEPITTPQLVTGKYTAVNIQRDRVEVRTFEGRYTVEDIIRYCELCRDLINFCSEIEPEDYIQLENRQLLMYAFNFYRESKIVLHPLLLIPVSRRDAVCRLDLDYSNIKMKVGA